MNKITALLITIPIIILILYFVIAYYAKWWPFTDKSGQINSNASGTSGGSSSSTSEGGGTSSSGTNTFG